MRLTNPLKVIELAVVAAALIAGTPPAGRLLGDHREQGDAL